VVRAERRSLKPVRLFLVWAARPGCMRWRLRGWSVCGRQLYAYEFDSALFKPKAAEAGYWVTREEVARLSVTRVGDFARATCRGRDRAAHSEELVANRRRDHCLGPGVFNHPQR
jgi:hypothetical protein